MAFGYNIDQRKINKRNHVIDLFRQHKLLSKAKAKDLAGYSMDTVISIFNSLVEDEIIIPAEGEQKAKGRKASFFSLNHDRRLYLGLTFNQSGIFSSIVSFSHEVKYTHKTSLNLGLGKEEFLKELREHLAHIFEKTPSSIASIGCSIPGDIDLQTGILHSYIFMPFLKELNFKDIMNELYPDVPVIIDHNIRSMTSYLLRDNSLIEKNDRILFVSARSGAAHSLIYKGEIVTGHGELGHIRVSDEERQCPCGRYGCLDCYFSYRSFIDIISQYTGRDFQKTVNIHNDVEGLEMLGQLYQNNDADIKALLEKPIRYFSMALLDCVNITAPDLIILSGDLLKVYGDPIKIIRETMARLFPSTGSITLLDKAEMIFMDLGTEIASLGVSYDMIRNEFGYYQEEGITDAL